MIAANKADNTMVIIQIKGIDLVPSNIIGHSINVT